MALTLSLVHLYARTMNLYGDRGNVLALYRRAQRRGIRLTLTAVEMGKADAVLETSHLVFMGGGQDAQQLAMVDDLHTHKATALCHLAEQGAVFLTICGGYQLLGHYYQPHDAPRIPGLGLIDAVTVAGPTRFIGNVVVERPDGSTLVGFENHSGLTTLGDGLQALGRVRTGRGNNGQDGTEGVCQGNLYGTYLHGALLPKNPALADELLKKALVYAYGESALDHWQDLPDVGEARAHTKALGFTA